MSKQNRDPESVVQSVVDAYSARDIDSFISKYRSDAVLARLHPGTVVATGQAEIRKVYGDLFEKNPALKCTIIQRILNGNFVVDKEKITGRSDQSERTATVIYEVEEGLISRVWFL